RATAPGRPVTVVVRGESGIGKSALVRRFVDLLIEEDDEVITLPSRCYERETVPFKGIDGVIDALSKVVVSIDSPALDDNVALLGQVFPVLGTTVATEVVDQRELRGRVFAALREILAAVGALAPLVITIDDLHWADADSLAVLGGILEPGAGAPRL